MLQPYGYPKGCGNSKTRHVSLKKTGVYEILNYVVNSC